MLVGSRRSTLDMLHEDSMLTCLPPRSFLQAAGAEDDEDVPDLVDNFEAASK